MQKVNKTLAKFGLDCIGYKECILVIGNTVYFCLNSYVSYIEFDNISTDLTCVKFKYDSGLKMNLKYKGKYFDQY